MYRVIAGTICAVLQIARSTYYYEAQIRDNPEEELTAVIINIFKQNRNNYGQRKTDNNPQTRDYYPFPINRYLVLTQTL